MQMRTCRIARVTDFRYNLSLSYNSTLRGNYLTAVQIQRLRITAVREKNIITSYAVMPYFLYSDRKSVV